MLVFALWQNFFNCCVVKYIAQILLGSPCAIFSPQKHWYHGGAKDLPIAMKGGGFTVWNVAILLKLGILTNVSGCQWHQIKEIKAISPFWTGPTWFIWCSTRSASEVTCPNPTRAGRWSLCSIISTRRPKSPRGQAHTGSTSNSTCSRMGSSTLKWRTVDYTTTIWEAMVSLEITRTRIHSTNSTSTNLRRLTIWHYCALAPSPTTVS